MIYSPDLAPAAVLCADPPWKFGDDLPGKSRGASKNYRCLDVGEIARFSLPPLADDCLLCLWRVASMQLEALAVVEAWGFQWPSCEIVWCKTTNDIAPHAWDDDAVAETKLRIGMGRLVRNAHEVALLCKRGKPKTLDHGVPSVIFAPRGKHSEKPEIFYWMIERLVPGPRAELFARRHRPGWSCFGDEIDGPVNQPAGAAE